MTGISLHMQWSQTSQSHGSFSQREQLVFHYGSNSTYNYICTCTLYICNFGSEFHLLLSCTVPRRVCPSGIEVSHKLVVAGSSTTWDRCYDFLNIFAEKFSKKIGVFVSKQSQILNNIGF
jgi:hypothetical protein